MFTSKYMFPMCVRYERALMTQESMRSNDAQCKTAEHLKKEDLANVHDKKRVTLSWAALIISPLSLFTMM